MKREKIARKVLSMAVAIVFTWASFSLLSVPKAGAEDFLGLPLDDYVAPTDRTYDTTSLPLFPSMNFITRSTDKLYDGSTQFRFISANCPQLLDVNPWEQEDAIKSIAQMGGQVVRTYTFSVNMPNNGETEGNNASGKFILGVNENGSSSTVVLNEAAMVRFDNLIAICRKYGIRLIVPLIDPYEYNGGIPAFLRLSGLTAVSDGGTDNMFTDAKTFYDNTVTRSAYLNMVDQILSRVNTVTGTSYYNEPAILAWQSGNELPFYRAFTSSPSTANCTTSYDTWMKLFSAKVKTYTNSAGTKPLVMDGAAIKMRNGTSINGLTPPAAYNDANLDIVDLHWYQGLTSNSLTQECTNFRNAFSGRRPNVMGEFGGHGSSLTGSQLTSATTTMYTNAISNGTTGVLFWSMRPHNAEGGFEEPTIQWTYHWPGFAGQTSSTDEINFLRATYLKAYEIRGFNPKLIMPSGTSIIASEASPIQQIRWQGSAGAYGYDIQRAETTSGPWTTIGVNVPDEHMGSTRVMFADTYGTLTPGKIYYYRIRARGTGGFTDWSSPTALVDKEEYTYTKTLINNSYIGGFQSPTSSNVNTPIAQAGQVYPATDPANGKHYMVTEASLDSVNKLSEYQSNGYITVPSSTIINDTFSTNPPVGATYVSGISPGDGNANSLVGRSWINGSLFSFITSNGYTNFVGDGSALPTVSREVVPDDTGVIIYDVNSTSETTLKLDVIGSGTLYGNLMNISEKWHYNMKWYEGIGTGSGSTPYPRRNQNTVYDYVKSYKDREPNISNAYAMQYYVYKNPAKGYHNTMIIKAPDDKWYMPTDYGSIRLMNQTGDAAIIASAVPVFKIEASTDGYNYTPLDWKFESVGICSQEWLDTWQGATIGAKISAGIQKIRITINSPSVFEFENPDQDVYGKPLWMNHGIWLRNAKIVKNNTHVVNFKYVLDENYDGIPDIYDNQLVLTDAFGTSAPAGATYSSGISPGDGNANSLVGTSWLNSYITSFVTNNTGTNYMSSGTLFASGMGREVCADDVGVVTYSVTADTPLKMSLNVIGRTTIYANNFTSGGNWFYAVKWYEGTTGRINQNTSYDYLQAYKDRDSSISAASPVQYYVYTNAQGHKVMIFYGLDGNWYMPDSYFNIRLMNQPGDAAIIAAAVPVFKVETSTDGINYSTVGWDFSTIGVCSTSGLDEWQAATVSANIAQGMQKVRITINSPSMFSFENPDLDVYGKPQWMNHGIWLQKVNFTRILTGL